MDGMGYGFVSCPFESMPNSSLCCSLCSSCHRVETFSSHRLAMRRCETDVTNCGILRVSLVVEKNHWFKVQSLEFYDVFQSNTIIQGENSNQNLSRHKGIKTMKNRA